MFSNVVVNFAKIRHWIAAKFRITKNCHMLDDSMLNDPEWGDSDGDQLPEFPTWSNSKLEDFVYVEPYWENPLWDCSAGI